MITVARRYKFTATHAIPQLAVPWNKPHSHHYTVEIVVASQRMTDLSNDLLPGFFDTDKLDTVWQAIGPKHGVNLNVAWPGDSSVESLAEDIFATIEAFEIPVQEVTVWEDDDRWGRARR